MAATYTTNKNLAEPQVNVDTGWGTTLNSDLSIIDGALGGLTTITPGGPGTIVLTASQYQNLNLTLLASSSGNVAYKIPSGVGGLWLIDAVGGPSVVTFGMVGSASSPIIIYPSNNSTLVYSDGTNVAIAAAAASNSVTSVIPSGTVMPFYQAAAPTGWAKLTTANDGVLRVVSGSTGGTGGGSVAFSTMFNSAYSGHTGNTTLTLTQLPVNAVAYGAGTINIATSASVTGAAAGNTAAGQGHNHPLQPLQYYDMIICSKN